LALDAVQYINHMLDHDTVWYRNNALPHVPTAFV